MHTNSNFAGKKANRRDQKRLAFDAPDPRDFAKVVDMTTRQPHEQKGRKKVQSGKTEIRNPEPNFEPCLNGACKKEITEGYYGRWGNYGTCSGKCERIIASDFRRFGQTPGNTRWVTSFAPWSLLDQEVK